MALSLDAAAEVFREAMRDTVKRYALWYLIQGALLIAAGILAIHLPRPLLGSGGCAPGLAAHHQRGRARPQSDRGAPRAAFLAAADLRHPGRADRVGVCFCAIRHKG